MATPTFLSNKSVTIVRTIGGGYLIAPRDGALAEECIYFKTWAELSAYMATNFPPLP